MRKIYDSKKRGLYSRLMAYDCKYCGKQIVEEEEYTHGRYDGNYFPSCDCSRVAKLKELNNQRYSLDKEIERLEKFVSEKALRKEYDRELIDLKAKYGIHPEEDFNKAVYQMEIAYYIGAVYNDLCSSNDKDLWEMTNVYHAIYEKWNAFEYDNEDWFGYVGEFLNAPENQKFIVDCILSEPLN